MCLLAIGQNASHTFPISRRPLQKRRKRSPRGPKVPTGLREGAKTRLMTLSAEASCETLAKTPILLPPLHKRASLVHHAGACRRRRGRGRGAQGGAQTLAKSPLASVPSSRGRPFSCDAVASKPGGVDAELRDAPPLWRLARVERCSPGACRDRGSRTFVVGWKRASRRDVWTTT